MSCCLIGDLNIDMMSTCVASYYYNYQNLLSNFNLIQHVTDPSSLMYHINCEYIAIYTNAGLVLSVKQTTGLNDHCVQIVQTLR